MRKSIFLVIILSLVLIIPYAISQISPPGCCATNICVDSDQDTCANIGGTFYSGQFCIGVNDCGCCVCNPDTAPFLFVDNIYSTSGCQAACSARGAVNFTIFPGKTIQECQQIGTRVVTGSVTDQDGNPLRQAEVTALPSARSTNTDEQGQYTLTLVNTGDTLTATYQGVSDTKTIVADVDVYDFVLTIVVARATLTGNVKDNIGQNVEGAALTLGFLETITDNNGDFTITNIDPGTYTFTVSKIGYLPYEETFSFAPGEVKTIDIVITSGQTTLTGKVTDPDGFGIALVSVVVQEIPGLFDSTDSTGSYSIPNTPFGTLTVTATPPTVDYLPQTKTITVSATNNVLDFTLPSVGPCSDATPRNTCSDNLPKFCNLDGQLLDNYCFGPDLTRGTIDDCGCSPGYECQIDGSCKLIQFTDCCKYEFQCFNILPAAEADCPPGSVGCAQECYPVEDCPENVALNDRSVVDPVCYCGQDIVVADHFNDYCCDLAGSPFISKQECPFGNYAIITGIVKDGATGQRIQAFITVDEEDTFISVTEDGAGYFSIKVTPEESHDLEFSKPNYFSKTITVDAPAREQTKDTGTITIDQKLLPCFYPETYPVPTFQAKTVKCKPYIELSWENEFCENIEGFVLIRENDGKQWLLDNNINEFTDKGYEQGLIWGETYNYSISAYYSDFQPRVSEKRYASITLGSAECENRCDENEFCLDAYKRVFCDEDNILTFATTARGDPSDCSDLAYTGYEWFCSGPDEMGRTWCSENGLCGYNVNVPFFGLFFTADNCYYDEAGDLQACYLDRSRTSVNFCFQCPSHDSERAQCHLYDSEFACEENQCGFKDCAWELGFFKQTGEGICYDNEHISDIKYNLKEKNLTSNCELCSKQARLFHNYGCDQLRCSKLGFCYSTPEDGGTCNDCTEHTACTDFKTREACIGATGKNQNFQLNTFNAPLTAAYSDDACGFGRCYWDGERCFKDGDSDRIKDCATRLCEEDNTAPLTEPLFEAETLNMQGQNLLFNVSEEIRTLYFCLYAEGSEPCTDFKTIIPSPEERNISLNPIGHFPDVLTREGGYILRYYSEDANRNKELIKEVALFIDPGAPTLSVEFFTTCVNCETPDYPKLSNVKFVIQASEVVKCVDEFQVAGQAFSSEYSGDTSYEKIYPETGGIDDGIYEYRLNCEDSVGNKASLTKTVKVDSYVMIRDVKPQGAIKETDVTFEAYTSERSTCSISIDGFAMQPMESVDKQYHSLGRSYANYTYHFYTIKCSEIGSDKVDSFTSEFVIDVIAPRTWVYINGELFEPPRTYWRVYKDNVSLVRLECVDEKVQGQELNFGCEKTIYCLTSGTGCTPNTQLGENRTVEITELSTLCYYSEDKGGNREERYCGLISVDGTKPMTRLFNITLMNPEYGVSPEVTTDFNVKTNKQGICGFVKNIPPGLFEQTTPFDKSDFITHIEPGLGIDAQYTDYQPVYVWCIPLNETLPDANTVFYLAYDLSKPIITSISANPAIVKEYPLETIVSVVTDDETLCKYGGDIDDYESAPSSFPDNNIYSTTHEVKIGNLVDGETYTYDVICKNLAGLVSDKQSIIFSVNLSLPAGINIITPKDGAAYNVTALPLDVRTDKRARCWYSENKDFPTAATNLFPYFDEDLKHFYTDDFNWSVGTHSIYVKCIFGTGAPITAKTEFIIDLTAPVNVSVNDGDFACSADRLNVTWDAQDDESGISEYDYVIQRKDASFDEETAEWFTTTQRSPEEVPDNLTTNIIYIAIVRARNKAGMVSDIVVSDGFTIDPTRPQCDETGKPIARIEKKQVYGGVKVSLVCEDESGCNDAADYYGVASSQTTCSASDPYEEPVLVRETSFFCWRVEDIAGNVMSGGETIQVKPTGCADDVDCDGLKDWEDPDVDGDGIPNCDDPDDDLDEIPDIEDEDDDNDNIPDSQEIDDDNDWDNDGLLNGEDNDDDCDGINDCEDDDDDNDGILDGPDDDDDNDGILDTLDVDHGGTTSPDGDNDFDNDGIYNPIDDDRDGDGISNDIDEDDDNDGVADCVDQDDDNDGIDDFRDPDNSNDWDKDGMPNDWERDNGLNPLYNDADEDADRDGLTNLQEYGEGTDPNDKDTDGDGWSDYDEFMKGFDPLDAEIHPPSYLWLWVLIIILVLIAGGAGYYFYIYFTARKEAAKPRPAAPPRAPPAVPPRPARPRVPVRRITPAEKREEAVKRIREIRRKRREAERVKVFEKFGKPKVELKKIPSAEEKRKKPAKPVKKEDIFGKVEKLARKEGDLDKLARITKKVKTKDEMERLFELSKKVKKPGTSMDKLMEVVEKRKKKKK